MYIDFLGIPFWKLINFPITKKIDILSKMTIIDLASAKVKILEILEFGFVQTSSNCQDQMRERDFSMRDILKVLQTGEVKPGKADGDYAKGIFRVYGHDNDGEPLGVTIEINENLNRLNIITGFGY